MPFSRFDLIDVDLDADLPRLEPEPPSEPFVVPPEELLRRLHEMGEASYRAGNRATLTPSGLISALFEPVERWGVNVARVWISARTYADLRINARDFLDTEGRRHLTEKGLLAYLWGAEIWVSRSIPYGYAISIGEDEGRSDLEPGWVPDVTKLVRLGGEPAPSV